MGKRYEAIGIKQVVRLEWYDYALNLLLNGQNSTKIRQQLDEYIRERLQSGGYGERGEQTYTKAVTQIMKCWVTPDQDLVPFRDDALNLACKVSEELRIALHWAMTVAAYPFWYRVAGQVGRLLNLQDTITQGQIRLRCFEVMGERTTVERSARRVIRSFVTWGVLDDSEEKGCYRKPRPICVDNPDLAVLLIESVLLTQPDGQIALQMLMNNPGFFPFQLPVMSGDFISRQSGRIDMVRYGLDDEMLKLRAIAEN